MNGKNKAEQLAKYVGKGRAKGLENVNRVLLWIYQWGWSTEPVLQKLLGVQRKIGCELARKGVLLRVEPPAGHRTAYVIAQAHQLRALELYEADTGMAIPYPWPRTAVPFAALGQHQEEAQLRALDELRPGDLLMVDREMRRGVDEAIPDFAIERGGAGGPVEWHEIELTPKYHERLLHQLEQRNQALRAGHYSRIVWHCRTHGIARNLAAALDKPVLPPVIKRADGRVVRQPGVEGWRTAALRAATTIHGPGGSAMQPGRQLEFTEESTYIDVADL